MRSVVWYVHDESRCACQRLMLQCRQENSRPKVRSPGYGVKRLEFAHPLCQTQIESAKDNTQVQLATRPESPFQLES